MRSSLSALNAFVLMIIGCSSFGLAFWFLGMWQWWAFYCWMALIVGISIGKPWLLCRLLSLLKILALIQHWVYVVWCAEYCGVPICVMWWCSTKQAKLMDRILQICGIEWCMDMKEKADDLETFCERFRRLCWLDGPNRSIIMLYLKIFDVRWFLKNIMLCLCVLFSAMII